MPVGTLVGLDPGNIVLCGKYLFSKYPPKFTYINAVHDAAVAAVLRHLRAIYDACYGLYACVTQKSDSV